MLDLRPSINEVLEKPDSLLWLQVAIEKRIANVSKEEQTEIDAFIQRALKPQCGFDRKHTRLLYAPRLQLFGSSRHNETEDFLLSSEWARF